MCICIILRSRRRKLEKAQGELEYYEEKIREGLIDFRTTTPTLDKLVKLRAERLKIESNLRTPENESEPLHCTGDEKIEEDKKRKKNNL